MKHKYLAFFSLSVIALLSITVRGYSQLNPLSIGTIPAGDSIVIKYDVLIDNPIPGGVTQVSNQGTISGGNFVSVLTDDPKTASPLDPTITLLNQWPLPVTLTEFSAHESGSIIQLVWKVASESNIEKYEVERSTDAVTFRKFGEVVARNTGNADQYSFPDNQFSNGNNYYRLKIIERNGTSKYSAIVRVSINARGELITIYPNPVVNKNFSLSFTNIPRGGYQVLLYNNAGQLVYQQSINHSGGSSSRVITIDKMLPGLYQLRITGLTKSITKSIIVR
jgi:hypothetical protein